MMDLRFSFKILDFETEMLNPKLDSVSPKEYKFVWDRLSVLK